MLRYLFVLLAILVAVLAVIFDHLWLYVGAGILFATGLGLFGWRIWKAARDDETTPSRSGSDASTESLEELGIVDIRPEDAEGSGPESSSASAREGERAEAKSKSTASASGSDASGATGSTAQAPSETKREGPEPMAERGAEAGMSEEQLAVTNEAPVLGPFLQSLRAALGAQTVGLLVQEEIALTYRIEALVSTHAHVQRSGTFDAQTPLLAAHMSHQSVSLRPLTEDEIAIEDLGYYKDPPAVDHVAVAPVPRPDEPTTTFLVADATAQSDLGSARAQALLEHFAEAAALLLESPQEASPVDEAETDRRAEADAQASSPADVDTDEESAEESADAPRPRREIIAEEMEAAEAASEELALVLVHLNRAESIARRGEDAVATAERLFQARLEQFASNQRVERFGELTYGIFFRGGVDVVEPWVADLEAAMAQEKGELEGGVSVGVAVRGAHHDDPEALRTAATEALREAYKTGTSTVVT